MLNEIVTPLVVTCRDGERLTQSERMKIGCRNARVEPFGLVDRQKNRLTGAVQLARHKHILRGESRPSVREQHQSIRFFYRAFSLDAHLRFDADGIFD
jgi:hypothetical protein